MDDKEHEPCHCHKMPAGQRQRAVCAASAAVRSAAGRRKKIFAGRQLTQLPDRCATGGGIGNERDTQEVSPRAGRLSAVQKNG